MNEASLSNRFRKWAKKNMPTSAIEIKHTRGSASFLVSELKEHQMMALKAAHGRQGLAYKIPDGGWAHKPFDMVLFKNTPAWVVIFYPDIVTVINVLTFEKFTKKKASLTRNDAFKIAFIAVRLQDLI